MDGYLETCDPLQWRQFVLAVKRLADNFTYGFDRSPFLGSGIEFVHMRDEDREKLRKLVQRHLQL